MCCSLCSVVCVFVPRCVWRGGSHNVTGVHKGICAYRLGLGEDIERRVVFWQTAKLN